MRMACFLVVLENLLLGGCGAANSAAVALCHAWLDAHPERASQPDGLVCESDIALQPFVTAINLAAAKAKPEAIASALADNPPISAPLCEAKP